MRRISFAISIAVLTIAITKFAAAADLPRRAPAYFPPPVPILNWTGFYVGGNAGYSWSNSSVDTVGTPGPFDSINGFGPSSDMAAALATTSLTPGAQGFIGGAQIGYNWQFNNWLAGFEADIQGLIHNDDTVAITSGPRVLPGFTDTFVSTTSVSKRVDWLGTVRGRLGFLATPSLLIYGTGGLAYGQAKADIAISQTVTNIGAPFAPTNAYGTALSFSDTRFGWTAGGGLEWMFAPQWSLKGEYMYYDLGKATLTLPDLAANDPACVSSPCWSAHVQSTTRFNGNIARAGINYHF